MEAKPLVREFVYQGTTLPDPNPNLNVEQARDVLATTHPELATAAIDGPTVKEAGGAATKHVYTFIRSVGTKG